MKEKVIIEKEKEKIINLVGLPLQTTPYHDNRARAMVFEIMNTTARSNLIPRVMDTTIMVYPLKTMFNADLLMQLQLQNLNYNSSSSSQGITNNSTSNGGANNINALANLRSAIASQNQDMIRTILDAQPDLVKSTGEDGLTSLSYAASKGFVDIAVYFLANFPRTTCIHNNDRTKSYPIHKACLGGHVRVLEIFHSKFPESLKRVDNEGQTILHVAAKERGNKLKHVVAYLLTLREGKELINKRDENRCTPLDLAINHRNGEVEQFIRRVLRQS